MSVAEATTTQDRVALERGVLARAINCDPPYWEDVQAALRLMPDGAWSVPEHAKIAAVVKHWKGNLPPDIPDYVAAGIGAVVVGDFIGAPRAYDIDESVRLLSRAYGDERYNEHLENLRNSLSWGSPSRARIHELFESFLEETQQDDGLLFEPLTDWPAVARQEIPFLGEFHTAPAIPQNHLSIIAAQPGIGKSTFALEIAAAVCWGQPCGGFTPTGHGSVLYLSAEDGGNIVAQRLEAATGEMGVREDEVRDTMQALRFRLMTEGCGALCEEDRDGVHATPIYQSLLDYCAKHQPRLIVIDPLAAFFLGDEDDAGQMAYFAGLLIKLARAANGAVLLVHHANKAGSRDLDMMSARGSVALVAASRYVASMRPLSESLAKRMGCEDELKQYVEVAVTKTSYGIAPDGSQFLRRGECGVLHPADLYRQRYMEIAERIAMALHECNAHLTLDEIAKGRGDVAKSIRDRLGDVSSSECRVAMSMGLEFGILRQANAREGLRGAPRNEIFPVL